jgi:hypothetical protein
MESLASWSPRWVETAVAAGCGVLALLVALVADPVGRILFGIAALGLLLLAASDLLLRPRLAAGPTGLQVRTLTSSRRLPWPEVERVEVDEHTRYGLTARTLELESDGELIVLGKRTLGQDPRDVADTLARIRYGA